MSAMLGGSDAEVRVRGFTMSGFSRGLGWLTYFGLKLNSRALYREY